jgi:hypothetical protein
MRQKVTQKPRFNFWDTWLWVVWVLILGGIVCVGLDPRGFRFGNEVAVGEGGLSLGRFGRVQAEIAGGVEGGFTVVVEGRAAGAGLRSFRTIAGFYELGGGGRLLIGQWRDNLVVGVGESPEDWWVDIPFFPSAGTRFELVVVSSREGTRIDRNGERVFEDPGVRLPMPRGPLRVTLGNSLEARHGWVGQLGMVAVLGEALGGGAIGGLLDGFAAGGVPLGGIPPVFFDFCGGGGRGLAELEVPRHLWPMEFRALAGPDLSDGLTRHFFEDAALNTAAFVPWGFVSVLLLVRRGARPWRALFAATAAGALLSLGIELGQVVLPPRDSCLMDLVTNTVGTFAGAAACVLVRGAEHLRELQKR